MVIQIATWNSRGNPLNDTEKTRVLNFLLQRNNIILLQESGTLDSNSFPNHYFFDGFHAGAYNPRCNSCIISDRRLSSKNRITLRSSNGRQCSYGSYFNIIVATLHANSATNALCDATGALAELNNQCSSGSSIILGGDFNAEPIEMSTGKTRSKKVGTRTRSTDFTIASPGRPTHTGGRTLDYFIVKNLRTENTDTHFTNGGSDHTPVMTTICPIYRGG